MIGDTSDPEDGVEEAARGVRAVATYFLIVAGFSLLLAHPFSLLVLAVAAVVLLLAWLLRTHQSRLAAFMFLTAATCLLGREVWVIHYNPHWLPRGDQVTGLLVGVCWFVIGLQAVLATVRYHSKFRARS